MESLGKVEKSWQKLGWVGKSWEKFGKMDKLEKLEKVRKSWEKLGKVLTKSRKFRKSLENIGKDGKKWEKMGKVWSSSEMLGKLGKVGESLGKLWKAVKVLKSWENGHPSETFFIMKAVVDSKDDIHHWFWPDQWICITLYIEFDIFHSSISQKLTELDLAIPQEHFLIPFVDIKDVLCSCI